MSAIKPFDFLNQINHGKENIIEQSENPEAAEKFYTPFVVNKGLSYFVDTVLLANEINQRHEVDNKLQFEFLLNSIRKRKRFSKWFKKEQDGNIDIIMNYYGYSHEKAEQVLPLFDEHELKIIKDKMFKGGSDGC
jgi:hypothetical protein